MVDPCFPRLRRASVAKAANISPDKARTRLTQAEQQARQTAAEATRKDVASAGIFGAIALVLGALAA